MSNLAKQKAIGLSRALNTLCVLILVCFTFAPLREASANNVRITNLTVHPYSSGDGEVEFDLAWDNSWRSTTEPYNWDAVWVFAKIRRNGGDWTHLNLKSTGHTIPQSPQALTTALGLVDTGAAYNASTNPYVGIFVYRTNDGFGTVTANDMRLRWNYSDNGASSGDVVEIRVVGVEMVYIPQGAFYAGDNATSANAFREKSTGDNDPWYISSENAITTTATTTGNYYYPGDGVGFGDAANSVFTIPADFPKGFGAFYMAKGELSQAAYAAFFNMLTSTQKSTRDITGYHATYQGKNTDAITVRNNLSWSGSGEMTLNGGTHGGVAMNYLAWADLTAFLDWAGLRPMSELEYEKAGRGPLNAVAGEYAWGSTSITQATSITNSGLGSERGQSGSNCAYNHAANVLGPLRIGSFAKGVSSRVASGGGFYGVMELSGNVYERAVTVGNSTGRLFQGRNHGNGVLASTGEANVTNWPGTNSSGAGFRGGTWSHNATFARLSDRIVAASEPAYRFYLYGGRGVRSAP
jgi:formylglycine-generating enzyme required for sulfatase activity